MNSTFESIIEIVFSLKLRTRIKVSFDANVSDWSNIITSPCPSYYEFSTFGPVSENQIDFLDIHSIAFTYRGKLIPDIKTDLKSSLVHSLKKHNVLFEDCGEYIRVYKSKL